MTSGGAERDTATDLAGKSLRSDDGDTPAAHPLDHALYPDCRPVFVRAMETSLHLCDWTDIMLHAPYLRLTKADIVKIGTRLGVDKLPHLDLRQGKALACGRGGS